MRVLALDTTTRAASVALVQDGTIVGEFVSDASQTHAQRMPADLLRVLQSAGLTLPAIDLFAVAAGPGSFTGLRIGIATIQGLAFVAGRRIVPISALEALAHAGSEHLAPGATVGAWMDARRRDVFSALYRVTSADVFSRDRLVEIDAPSVGHPGAVLERWAPIGTPDVFIGDGATLFASLLGEHRDIRPMPALAGVIGRLAVERGLAGESVDPAGVRPLYIRRPDAEIAREQAKNSRPAPQDAR